MSVLPDTVYVAIWDDRHRDTSVHTFDTAEGAIGWSRTQVRSLYPDDLDEDLTPAMREAGWLYYGCYSLEGDNIRVVPSVLHRAEAG